MVGRCTEKKKKAEKGYEEADGPTAAAARARGSASGRPVAVAVVVGVWHGRDSIAVSTAFCFILRSKKLGGTGRALGVLWTPRLMRRPSMYLRTYTYPRRYVLAGRPAPSAGGKGERYTGVT